MKQQNETKSQQQIENLNLQRHEENNVFNSWNSEGKEVNKRRESLLEDEQ